MAVLLKMCGFQTLIQTAIEDIYRFMTSCGYSFHSLSVQIEKYFCISIKLHFQLVSVSSMNCNYLTVGRLGYLLHGL